MYGTISADVCRFMEAALLLISQATFLASGVKKLLRPKVKDAAELLKEDGILALLDSMEDGRTRYTKSLNSLLEIQGKIEKNMAVEEPLAKLLEVASETPNSFEKLLKDPMWDDCLGRRASLMEEHLKTEYRRLNSMCNEKHSEGDSPWKQDLSPTASTPELSAAYHLHLENLDGKELKKGIKELSQVGVSQEGCYRFMLCVCAVVLRCHIHELLESAIAQYPYLYLLWVARFQVSVFLIPRSPNSRTVSLSRLSASISFASRPHLFH